MSYFVIPAKAGIQWAKKFLDSRLRGNDISGVCVFLFSCFLVFLFLAASSASAAAPAELQSAIDGKNRELQALAGQIAETQKNLSDTEEKSKSLKQELNRINYTTNQLNLNIRSSQITIDKLGLEINGLQYGINDAETKSDLKKSAIEELLRNVQHNDDESGLLVLLKNKTLSASMLESQSLSDLNDGLSAGVAELAALRSDLTQKLNAENEKKNKIESEKQALKARQAIALEQKTDRQTLLTQTKNQESAYQKQLDDLKKQQNTLSDEIGVIEDQLRATFNPDLLPGKRPGVFMWPTQMIADGGRGRVTQHYGEVSRLYRGKPHNGLDIGIPTGTPVFAADDGVVMHADNNDQSSRRKYQYGKYVLIRHNNNIATIYGHLSLQVVKDGAVVKRGDIIGYSGNTGYATGAHLHFGAYWAPSIVLKSIWPAAGLVPVGVTINPESYL